MFAEPIRRWIFFRVLISVFSILAFCTAAVVVAWIFCCCGDEPAPAMFELDHDTDTETSSSSSSDIDTETSSSSSSDTDTETSSSSSSDTDTETSSSTETGSTWILGGYGFSCEVVCSSAGMQYSEITATYSGSSGDDEKCFEVLELLDATGDQVEDAEGFWGMGCHYNKSSPASRFRELTETTPEDSNPNIARACACEVTDA